MSSLSRAAPTREEGPTVQAASENPSLAAPATASGEVGAQFDSPTHVSVGDSVDGAGVTVNEVTFSPGELAALVDYVGPDLTVLFEYSTADLKEMQRLLNLPREQCEDTEKWDELTNGMYSKLSLDNDDHFAPGSNGGANFESSFLDGFTAAFATAQLANEAGPGTLEYEAYMARARLELYAAEHYLQDAFSAGHQVSAGDVEAQTQAVLATTDFEVFYPAIAAQVFQQKADVISQYGRWDGPIYGYNPIDSLAEFMPLAVGGALLKRSGGVVDAVRKAVHEQLEVGIEVSCPLHPEPFMLPGDHDLDGTDEAWAVLRDALSCVRTAIENCAHAGMDASKEAHRLWEQVRPVPTAAGQALVDQTLADATADPMALADAVAFGTAETIEEAMDYVARSSLGYIARITEKPSPPPETPPEQPQPAPPEQRQPEPPEQPQPLPDYMRRPY